MLEFFIVFHSKLFLTAQILSVKFIVLRSYCNYQLNRQPETSTPKLHLLKIVRIWNYKKKNIAVYDSIYNENPQV